MLRIRLSHGISLRLFDFPVSSPLAVLARGTIPVFHAPSRQLAVSGDASRPSEGRKPHQIEPRALTDRWNGFNFSLVAPAAFRPTLPQPDRENLFDSRSAAAVRALRVTSLHALRTEKNFTLRLRVDRRLVSSVLRVGV